ncbi:MAG: tRNA pseudouridine synthase B [Alphaproteobacteria bacterium]|nr:MAG: tRNA pseudouridine synthase B [Alphaproteobacteria bacterium]
MASRKGNPVHGWVILDKPEELSSSRAVGIVRRVFNAAKAGHGGTLDPLATGILPIALGEATKTVSFAMHGAKSYEFTLQFGSQTSTDDREGEVIATSDNRPERAAIEAALPALPARSTSGRPSFPPSRWMAGVPMTSRAMRWPTGWTAFPSWNHDRWWSTGWNCATLMRAAPLFVACGKGTYIRSLARDLAVALGTVGHVSRLRRLSVGPFDESDAISLAFLEKLEHSAAAFEHLKPVTSALDDIPALPVSAGEAAKLRHGQTLPALSPAAEARFAEIVAAGTGWRSPAAFPWRWSL